MRISGIDHVQITIPTGAESEARAFYCDLLGLPEIRKPAILSGRGGFWLSVGLTPLHVGTEPAWDRSVTKAHVALTVDDVPAWRDRIEAAGYETQVGAEIPGRARFEFRDPFGNRLEIISPEP